MVRCSTWHLQTPIGTYPAKFGFVSSNGLTPTAGKTPCLDGTDDAANWAQRRMADKNRSSPADARKLEEAFQARLVCLSVSTSETAPQRNGSRKSVPPRRTLAIDKSALTLPEPRRARDREHVRLVAQKACLICGGPPRTRITFGSPKAARWGERSAMNSPSHCAAGTIANCIVPATRPHGGRSTGLTRR